MDDRSRKYVVMIDNFLQHRLGYDDLWSQFNDEFIKEEGLPEELYSILDAIWGDLEVTTSDKSLLADRPREYLDERELRERLAANLKLLHK